MKTNKAPWDYDRPTGVGKPQTMKLCDECGANMWWKNEYLCPSCPNKSYVLVKENEVADFRTDLAAAQEIKRMLEWELVAAIYRIDQPEEQVDAFLTITERPEYDPFYLDEEVEVKEVDEGIEWRIGNDVIFGSKEWFDSIPEDDNL